MAAGPLEGRHGTALARTPTRTAIYGPRREKRPPARFMPSASCREKGTPDRRMFEAWEGFLSATSDSGDAPVRYAVGAFAPWIVRLRRATAQASCSAPRRSPGWVQGSARACFAPRSSVCGSHGRRAVVASLSARRCNAVDARPVGRLTTGSSRQPRRDIVVDIPDNAWPKLASADELAGAFPPPEGRARHPQQLTNGTNSKNLHDISLLFAALSVDSSSSAGRAVAGRAPVRSQQTLGHTGHRCSRRFKKSSTKPRDARIPAKDEGSL